MKTYLPFAFVLIMLISACGENEDQEKTVDKKGSIEVILSTRHIDSLKDELTSNYTVWRNGSIVREYNKKDTIPGLETFKTEGEDDNGNTQDVKVKKDYEFFVTVK